MGITQKYSANYRISIIRDERNKIAKGLAKEGFSYGEISEIIRLDKASISRIVRFGTNKKSSPVTGN